MSWYWLWWPSGWPHIKRAGFPLTPTSLFSSSSASIQSSELVSLLVVFIVFLFIQSCALLITTIILIIIYKLPVNFLHHSIRIIPNKLALLAHSIFKNSPITNNQQWPPFNSALISALLRLSRPYISSVHGTTTLGNFLLPKTRPPQRLAHGREHSDSKALLFKPVNDTGTTYVVFSNKKIYILTHHP
jgi:hypothetical protein